MIRPFAPVLSSSKNNHHSKILQRYFSLVVLFIIIINATSTSTTTSNDKNDEKNSAKTTISGDKRSFLSLDEIHSILLSEVNKEFGILNPLSLPSSSPITQLWNESMKLEWENAEKEERNNNQRRQRQRQRRTTTATTSLGDNYRPFLICDKSGRNGDICMHDIESILDQPVLPIYNKREMSCFVARSLPSIIQSRLNNEYYISNPMSVEMKLQKDIVDTISNNDNNDDIEIDTNSNDKINIGEKEGNKQGTNNHKKIPTRYQAMFCPGETSTKEDATNLAKTVISIIKNNDDDGGNNNSTRSRSGEGKNRRRRKLRHNQFLKSRRTRDKVRESFWHRQLLFTREEEGENEKKSNNKNDIMCQNIYNTMDVDISKNNNLMIMTFNDNYNGNNVGGEQERQQLKQCIYGLIIDLAMQNEICFVSIGIKEVRLLNNVASGIIQSGNDNDNRYVGGSKRKKDPFHDIGLDGTGQVVSVSDSGLDIDNCYFWDSSNDVPKNTDGTINLSHRKIIQYNTFADDSDEFSGHGTHTSATIVGRRSIDGKVESDGIADGIAKGAKLAFFDIGHSDTGKMDLPSDIYTLLNPGFQAGARIHSASWGESANFYTTVDHELDVIMYQNPEFLFVAAAGNAGFLNRLNTVGTPAINKNGIAVGATHNDKPHVYDGMRGSDYLAWFSSRGPTSDGRIVPHVLAPGHYVQSARAVSNIKGECDNGSEKEGEEGISSKSGTSMAAPMIAGAAAIIRQFFIEGWFSTNGKGKGKTESDGFVPRASLIKAVLINGAQPLSGIENLSGQIKKSTRPYDFHQGFGRINLLKSLPLSGENNIQAIIRNSRSISNAEHHKYDIVIDSNGANNDTCNEALSATLVWTDPIVAPFCANCVLNDLDLFITKKVINNGREELRYYYPNGLNSADNVNNVERIRIENPVDRTSYTIHVKGSELIESQEYSLVITGCITEEQIINSPSKPVTSPVLSPQQPYGSSLLKLDYELPPTNAPIPTIESPTDTPINPGRIDCLDEQGLVNVTSDRMENCDFIKRHPYSFGFLCNFLDVARVCSQTCQKCHLIDQLPSTNDEMVTFSRFDGRSRWYGTKFNVKAKSNIIITGVDIHTAWAGNFDVEIYTMPGRINDFSNTNNNNWEVACKTKVKGQGKGFPTVIPSDVFRPIRLSEGEYISFYITLTIADLVLILDDKSSSAILEPVFENNDLSIGKGVAVTYLHRKILPNYLWDGRFRYEMSKDDDDYFYDGSTFDDCRDRDGDVLMNNFIGSRSCEWLAAHFDRLSHVCSYTEPAIHCPKTCGVCDEKIM